MTLARGRLTSEGVLLIDSREHRTQAQNRAEARARLIGLAAAGHEGAKEAPAHEAARRRAGKTARIEETEGSCQGIEAEGRPREMSSRTLAEEAAQGSKRRSACNCMVRHCDL